MLSISRPLAVAAAVFAMAGVASAHELVFTVDLSGPNEAPPNASPGTGSAIVTMDLDLVTLRVQMEFQGLIGLTSACHIHGPTASPGTGTAGVMTMTPTFLNFPLGVASGTYDRTFDMTLASSYNPAFITANGGTVSTALNAMIAAMEAGKSYLNIHTNAFPPGEIRGFLVPTPGAAVLLGLGGLVAARRRRA